MSKLQWLPATLPVSQAPQSSTAPLGDDADCADDITEDWADCPPDGRLAYVQANYRRLVLSELFYASPPSSYGLGVHKLLLETGLSVSEISAMVQRELLKDERTQSVKTEVLNTVISITVTPHSGRDFTMAISRVSGELL